MQLYLVQHGASKNETEDPQRGLTDEGRRVVEHMAHYLAAVGVAVERIEHSEKLRARQTAEILAAALHPRDGTKQVSGIAPNDDVQSVRKRLQTGTNDLMLVGHLPYLSRLVATLLDIERDRTLVEFRMGGVVRLGRNESGQWTLLWAIIPDLLPALAPKREAA
jgi:phosphohistidine phosphatase